MDEGTVRMQAQMYSLVALMEATKASIAAMQATNYERTSAGLALAWNESYFEDCRLELVELSRRLREEI